MGQDVDKHKQLFGIRINWFGEVHTVFRHAYTDTHAWVLARRILSMRLGVSENSIDHHVLIGDKRKIWKEGTE